MFFPFGVQFVNLKSRGYLNKKCTKDFYLAICNQLEEELSLLRETSPRLQIEQRPGGC